MRLSKRAEDTFHRGPHPDLPLIQQVENKQRPNAEYHTEIQDTRASFYLSVDLFAPGPLVLPYFHF